MYQNILIYLFVFFMTLEAGAQIKNKILTCVQYVYSICYHKEQNINLRSFDFKKLKKIELNIFSESDFQNSLAFSIARMILSKYDVTGQEKKALNSFLIENYMSPNFYTSSSYANYFENPISIEEQLEKLHTLLVKNNNELKKVKMNFQVYTKKLKEQHGKPKTYYLYEVNKDSQQIEPEYGDGSGRQSI